MDSTNLLRATVVLLFALLGHSSAQCVCNSTVGMLAQAGCSTPGTCCQWEVLEDQTSDDETLYEDATTPRGFATSSLPSVENSEIPRPCVSISVDGFTQDTTSYVIVWGETYADGISLCIQQVGGGERVCGTKQVQFCELAIASSVNVMFTCDSCDNSDQSFYFKTQTETLTTDDDQFCGSLEGIQKYPSDPETLITSNVPPTVDDTPDNGARSLTVLSPLALLLVAIATRIFFL